MKSKLEIYALAVCFASIVCLIISIGIAGYSIIEITAPKITMSSHNYQKYQTNDAYWQSKWGCSEQYKATSDKTRPKEEEITKQRLDAFALAIEGEQREGFQTLIKCLMFILISGIVLFVHWRIAKNARK